MSKPQGCLDVRGCVSVCARELDRTTQVFSPRPPRYHQSLSSSFIKHCRCTWAWMPRPSLMSTCLFLLLFHSFPPGGPFQTQLSGGQWRCKFVHSGGACWCRESRKKKGKGINKEERTAGNISIPPIVLCSLPLPWSKKNPPLNRINPCDPSSALDTLV